MNYKALKTNELITKACSYKSACFFIVSSSKQKGGDEMKNQKIKLECLECGNKFVRSLGPKSLKVVTCPKCKSTDIELAR